jgi:hypothetical protein
MTSTLNIGTANAFAHDHPVTGEVHAALSRAGFEQRQIAALGARLGLDGGGARTLQAAGERVGYTRERVRQLEQQLRLRLTGAGPQLQATQAALEVARRTAPAAAVSVMRELASARLVSFPFDVSGLLRVADVFGLEHELRLVGGAVLRHRDVELADKALAAGRRLVRRDGAANVAALARMLRGQASAGSLRRLLSLSREVTWLDSRETWFAVDGGSTRVARSLRKMLSVTPSLTFAEIRHGLRAARRPIDLPLGVVLALCEPLPWLVVDRARRRVTIKAGIDRMTVLTPLELELVGIFAEHGPVLGFTEVVGLAQKRGITRSTVAVSLTRTPVLERLGRGRYALRGRAEAAIAA